MTHATAPDPGGGRNRRVLLGFGAARGYAGTDLTSTALAAAAGGLPDTAVGTPAGDATVTELRIHGVSGSNGPTMLEDPQALQVGGDTVTGFYRRWSPDGAGRPSVPWKLEAYSWGGLTEAPLASAAWILLAPLMFYNVAHFALPPFRADGDRQHRIARALLRLLALAATVQFTAGVVAFLANTTSWQAASIGALPAWLGWLAGLPTGGRAALSLVAVAVVLGVLCWLSMATAHRYERMTTSFYQHGTQRPADSTIARDRGWALSRPGFWAGGPLVARQRLVHLGAAAAAAALLVALPAAGTGLGIVEIALAAAVLLGAVLLLPSRDLDWEATSQATAESGHRTGRWCVLLGAAGAVALVLAAVAGPADYPAHRAGALPGTAGFFAGLLIAQGVLLLALLIAVLLLARRAPAAPPKPEAQPPYFGGAAAWLLAALGVVLGGILTAVLNVALARMLGTPVPTGFSQPGRYLLALPGEMYALVAAAWGMLAGLIGAAVLVAVHYLRARRRFLAGTGTPKLTDAYPGIEHPGHNTSGRTIAGAWSVARLVDQSAAVLAFLVGGALAGFAAAEIVVAGRGDPQAPAPLHGPWAALVNLGSLLMSLFAALLLILLRKAYSSSSARRTIGAIWDVGTFWPRAAHPLGPPSYGERAVPELVDRVRLLAGDVGPDDPAWLRARTELLGGPELPSAAAGPVLITGYSQGSIIATAVVAQLAEPVRGSVGLLTLGCPVRRLYGRAFPAYFGETVRPLAAEIAPCSWKNVVRASDFIGGWVERDPLTAPGPHDRVTDAVDQVCLDPPVAGWDGDPTPLPIHAHLDFWPDPRVGAVSAHLVAGLSVPRD